MKTKYKYFKLAAFRRLLVFLSLFFIIIIIPVVVDAYGGGDQACFTPGDCFNKCTASGYCPDNQKGYNAYCKETSTRCPAGLCEERKATLCEYKEVILPASCTLSANPSSINSGESSILRWDSSNATQCSAGWTGSDLTSGDKTVSPSSTKTYGMTCTGPGGSGSCSATVIVNNPEECNSSDNHANGSNDDCIALGGPICCIDNECVKCASPQCKSILNNPNGSNDECVRQGLPICCVGIQCVNCAHYTECDEAKNNPSGSNDFCIHEGGPICCDNGVCVQCGCGQAKICDPGTVETITTGCENCGTRIATCKADCTWWYTSCSNEGCFPGSTKTRDCPTYGTQSSTCGDSCDWGHWTNCGPYHPTLIAPENNVWITSNPIFKLGVSDPDNDDVRAEIWIPDRNSYFLGTKGKEISFYPETGSINLGPCSIHTTADNETRDGWFWTAAAKDEHGAWSDPLWASDPAYGVGWWYTKIDTEAPIPSVSYYPTPIRGVIYQLNFTVKLLDSVDTCSGIRQGEVEINIKPNNGVWTDWRPYLKTTNDFVYPGIAKYKYQFRYKAQDNAKNWSGWVYGEVVEVAANKPPTATNLSATPSDPCNRPAQYYSFRWTYTDPNGDTQKRFDLQVDNNSDFSSPIVNRTQDNLSGPAWASPNENSQIVSLATSPVIPDSLLYNTLYYWRARVYDEYNLASGWVNGSSFTTSIHHYPAIYFNWAPTRPNVNETAQFNDASICWDVDAVNGSDCSSTKADSYLWTFPSGTPASSVLENPTTKFSTPGNYNVSLRVTDTDGHACTDTQSVIVDYPMPKWKEIRPW